MKNQKETFLSLTLNFLGFLFLVVVFVMVMTLISIKFAIADDSTVYFFQADYGSLDRKDKDGYFCQRRYGCETQQIEALPAFGMGKHFDLYVTNIRANITYWPSMGTHSMVQTFVSDHLYHESKCSPGIPGCEGRSYLTYGGVSDAVMLSVTPTMHVGRYTIGATIGVLRYEAKFGIRRVDDGAGVRWECDATKFAYGVEIAKKDVSIVYMDYDVSCDAAKNFSYRSYWRHLKTLGVKVNVHNWF